MFSGHGAELNGEHYLLAKEMVDEPERLKTRAVHQQDVLKKIEAKNPIVTLAILDCCREKVSGGAPRSAFGGPGGLAALPVAYGGHDSDDSERGGDDDFNDNCEVPASEDAEMMGWDTYDDDYVGS